MLKNKKAQYLRKTETQSTQEKTSKTKVKTLAKPTAGDSEIDRLMPLIKLASNGVCAACFAAIQVNQTCIE